LLPRSSEIQPFVAPIRPSPLPNTQHFSKKPIEVHKAKRCKCSSFSTKARTQGVPRCVCHFVPQRVPEVCRRIHDVCHFEHRRVLEMLHYVCHRVPIRANGCLSGAASCDSVCLRVPKAYARRASGCPRHTPVVRHRVLICADDCLSRATSCDSLCLLVPKAYAQRVPRQRLCRATTCAIG
jgi:hypothetical protein